MANMSTNPSSHPASGNIQAATDLDADPIIIASQGRTGLRHLVPGSAVGELVRQALYPALNVRAKGTKTPQN